MAFAASFTVTQSSDGQTVTLTDTSNYGDGGFYNKTDFAMRTLFVTRGDNTNSTSEIDFPYTNTNNSIQDTYAWMVTQDWVYSINMVLTDTSDVDYSYTAQVIISEFTNKKLKEILAEFSTCGCSDSCNLTQKIQCGLDSATARACAADISQAQKNLEYVNELADNHLNC